MPTVGLFLIAVCAGLVGAITGMGGGVVLLPVLTVYGVDIKHAIAVSILSSIVISGSAAASYTKEHLANLRVDAFLELFAVVGALIGASIALAANPRVLSFLCGIFFILSCFILWKPRQQVQEFLGAQDALSRWLKLQGSYYDRHQRRTIAYRAMHPALGGALVLVAGFVTGCLGIGGSAFVVLTQHAVMKLPPKVAVSTSNLIIGSMALAGASLYLEARLIDARLATPVVLGVFIGALIGSFILSRFTNQRVRKIFISVLIVLGLEMIFRALS